MHTDESLRVHRRLFVEKTVLEIAAALALAAVYFLAAPMLLDGRRQEAIAPFVTGQWSSLIVAVAAMWGGAAVCGALLGTIRPEGALAVVLVAAAGASAYSSPMRTLLWRFSGDLGGLYLKLIVELLLGGVVVIVAAVIAETAQSRLRALSGRRAWKSPLDDVVSEEGDRLKGDAVALAGHPGGRTSPTLGCLTWLIRSLPGVGSKSGDRKVSSAAWRQRASCAAVTILASVILLALLARSADRKQVLFAVFTSFLLGSLIAHRLFPTSCTILMWLAPVAVGAAVYGTAAFMMTGLETSATEWRQVPDVALALPIDWLAVGGAGGVIGAWISQRHAEQSLIETHDGEA